MCSVLSVGSWTVDFAEKHPVMLHACGVTGLLGSVITGSATFGAVALPAALLVLEPFLLPVFFVFCTVFALGYGTALWHFVRCHNFNNAPSATQKTGDLPLQNPQLVPGEVPAPEEAPIIPIGKRIYRNELQSIDVTTLPHVPTNLPNNGGRCFANASLQELYAFESFRHLVFVVCKIIPKNDPQFSVWNSLGDLFWCLQNGRMWTKSEMDTFMAHFPFFRFGEHCAFEFRGILLDILSEKTRNLRFGVYVEDAKKRLSIQELTILSDAQFYPNRDDSKQFFRYNIFCRHTEKGTGALMDDWEFNGCHLYWLPGESLEEIINGLVCEDGGTNKLYNLNTMCAVEYTNEHKFFGCPPLLWFMTAGEDDSAHDAITRLGHRFAFTINIDRIVSEPSGRSYALKSIVCYLENSKHYVAYVRVNDQWWFFDDLRSGAIRVDQSVVDGLHFGRGYGNSAHCPVYMTYALID
ncbi:MAG: ubiquitin carboxyl-terminal hydrolase [Puniceicoccales bacterium]|jgi:hypothetical protein|nr:ubiquitin carboxyl-terminal hydrolase [Puniceicoccales bacterium]